MFRNRCCTALLLLGIALFPIGASLPLACCAGVTSNLHASAETKLDCGACCDQAPADAIARHCCQGGDSFARPQSMAAAPSALAVWTATKAATIPGDLEGLTVALSVRDPIPRLEPLYRLHASLLL
jgi:hypothetical protein